MRDISRQWRAQGRLVGGSVDASADLRPRLTPLGHLILVKLPLLAAVIAIIIAVKT